MWPWAAALGGSALAAFQMLGAVDAVFAVPFAGVVLYLARTDLDRFGLPDRGDAALFALGMIWVGVSREDAAAGLAEALVRALAAAGFLLAVRVLYRSVRKIEGLGLGDVKLAGAGAVWLSWPQMPVALLIGAVAGVLVAAVAAASGRQSLTLHVALPLGAFLAPAIWLVWFAGAAGLF